MYPVLLFKTLQQLVRCFNDQDWVLPWTQQPVDYIGSKDRFVKMQNTDVREEEKYTCMWLPFFSWNHIYFLYIDVCVWVCTYICECFHVYVIHVLLRGLEKELRMQTAGRMISKCSLESWSCKESNTLPVMTHISPVKPIIYPRFCNISNSLCLILPCVPGM